MDKIKSTMRIVIMPKLNSNRVIANGTDYEVSKQKVQYQVPSIEKFNVGDFVGDDIITGKIESKVRLTNIVEPLKGSKWVEIFNL